MKLTRNSLLLILTVAVLYLSAPNALIAEGFGVLNATNTMTEKRCGWFSNPTPANAWLIDPEDEWTISIQGGYQAEGDWPAISGNQWVKTNGFYGYGCACMVVESDSETHNIIRIESANARPLSACRKDKAIKNKEPK